VLNIAKHHPKQVLFTGRNTKAAESVIEKAKKFGTSITFIQCDHSSLSSVSQAGRSILEKSGGQMDVIICNAGIMAVPYAQSKDGYEIQFAVNHLSHALLIKQMMPALQRSADERGDARIVSLSSLAFKSSPGINYESLTTNGSPLGELTQLGFLRLSEPKLTSVVPGKFESLGKWEAYCQSKLATVLYTLELAKRYPKVTVTALQPGVIQTGLITSMSWIDRFICYLATIGMQRLSVEEGAYNSLWAATSKMAARPITSGTCYEPVGKIIELTPQSSDPAETAKFWDWTESALAQHL
jgi:NAD(P)-dependent dehydrogenase (short-subunit alcohol dehydrogenase family)